MKDARHQRGRPARGMTLIELLIVLAILALLMQLLLPAIMASREAARAAQCKNNLRQMGIACHIHLGRYGRMPTGGWGYLWVGDPDRGNDRRQPGGWIYNILPFIELQPLREMGKGRGEEEKRAALTRLCQKPVPLFICPSRRRVRLYGHLNFDRYRLRNTNFLEESAKTDYAANAGDHYVDGPTGPRTLREGDSGQYAWIDPEALTGVIFQRSEIRLSDIADGTTSTYLIGEKLLDAKHYKDGLGGGDDQTLYVGYDQDVNRWTMSAHGYGNPPMRDYPHFSDWTRFGSAHPSGCHFAFCDGSVRMISYDVDARVHQRLGNRRDGQRVELPGM